MKKKSPKMMKILKEQQERIEKFKSENLVNSYLGNRGYTIYKSSLPNDIIEYIKTELIAKPFVNNQIEPTSFPIYLESDTKIYVPRFWGIKNFGYPKKIKIKYGEDIDVKFHGKLRTEPVNQPEVINSYLEAIEFNNTINRGNSSALIELLCGAGKTVLGLKIIEILKKKTIIFVHKTFLKNQWIERIKEFLPDAKIGTIQGQVIDIDNKDIVIAMIQSISMKSYPESIFDSFGFAIYDEVHHISSEIFNNCLKKCTTIYSLGLSATMNRKDGLSYVFKMFLGDICYKNQVKSQQDNVLVKAIDYHYLDNYDEDDNYNMIERDFRGNVKYTTMLSKVSNLNYRSDFIISVILNELKINPNQQILLLAHQRNLLNYLYKNIENQNFTSIGYYVGGMKQDDLNQSEKKQIILATYSMAAEALDIKTLTTLVLATPKSDIVQAVGRILRAQHSNPLVIDIIDQHDVFLNQFNKRRQFYNEKNYKIVRCDNENYQKILNDDKLDIWRELVNKKKSSKLNNKCLISVK
tara:strand:- start:366 stop:1934 length:1569 start_codon:yes stop_codon:yes gene_type:complete